MDSAKAVAWAAFFVALISSGANAETVDKADLMAVDLYMLSKYQKCWVEKDSYAPSDYVPAIRIERSPDGRLSKPPVLLNPPTNPRSARIAAQALDVVKKCDPITMPRKLAGLYRYWRQRTVRFDPQYMAVPAAHMHGAGH